MTEAEVPALEPMPEPILLPGPPTRVFVLIATIPPRKVSCERLLVEVSNQYRKPDGVILLLDGYADDAPRPNVPATLEAITTKYNNPTAKGAGDRWLCAVACINDPSCKPALRPNDIIVCLDDDIMLMKAPRIISKLAEIVESSGGAAAAMGASADGKRSPPGVRSRGALVYGAACGLAVRAKHLIGLNDFAAGVIAAGGPDALGLLGDDDALVSAHLWKTGVKIMHAPVGNIFPAPAMRPTSQTAARVVKKEPIDAQKLAIKKITGWPWVSQGVMHAR